MALLFMDSFDHYVTADLLEKWTTETTTGGFSTSGIVAAIGRRGSAAYRLSHNAGSGARTQSLQRFLTAGNNTLIVGFALAPMTAYSLLDPGTDPDSGACLLVARAATIAQSWIKINTDGTLSAMRAGTSTVIGTTSAPLASGGYTYLEVLLTIHDTAGAVVIRFNGAEVLNLSSVNTRGSASAVNGWDAIRLGPIRNVGASGNAQEFRIDDLYVLDGTGAAPTNAFLGDVRVDARYPTAPGATTGWTPSAGANWQCLDETAPNDDTDYTSAPAAGLTDTFVVEDAPVAGAQLFGVQHCLSARKTDAGAATIAPVIRHSGVDYPGAGINPGTAYAYALQIAALNPGTGVPWTEAGFNAAEFGYTRTV